MLKIRVNNVKKNVLIYDISKEFYSVQLSGNLGVIKKYLRKEISILLQNNIIMLKPIYFHKKIKMLLHTYFFILKNSLIDINFGFFIFLEIRGVGFKVYSNLGLLTFNLGLSHKVNFELPDSIICKIIDDKNTIFFLMGNDRQVVLSTGIKICSLKNRDPYKGKGIYFYSEVLKLKAGKSKKKI